MKKVIILLTMMVNSPALFAQEVVTNAPGLYSYLQTKKKSVNIFRCNTELYDYNLFIKIYNQQALKKSKPAIHPNTLMYGPVALSAALPVDIIYQRLEDGRGPSSALQILSIVAGFTASALYPNYYQWNNNESPIDVYLRSTYRQYER